MPIVHGERDPPGVWGMCPTPWLQSSPGGTWGGGGCVPRLHGSMSHTGARSPCRTELWCPHGNCTNGPSLVLCSFHLPTVVTGVALHMNPCHKVCSGTSRNKTAGSSLKEDRLGGTSGSRRDGTLGIQLLPSGPPPSTQCPGCQGFSPLGASSTSQQPPEPPRLPSDCVMSLSAPAP